MSENWYASFERFDDFRVEVKIGKFNRYHYPSALLCQYRDGTRENFRRAKSYAESMYSSSDESFSHIVYELLEDVSSARLNSAKISVKINSVPNLLMEYER